MSNLKDALNDPHAKIIDVRTVLEHAEISLKCPHILKPLHELDIDSIIASEGLSKDTPLYFLCKMGGRATQAADKFKARGFQNCHVIDGGITACQSCDTISKTGASKIIPLDGQVRIAIGIVLLLITFAGFWVAQALFVLVGFLASILIISGLTGWCGLALLLARAPWNKTKR